MKGDDCLAFSSLHPAFGQKGKAGGLLGRPTDDTQRQRLPTRHAGHGLKPIRTGSTVGHIIANKPIEKTGRRDRTSYTKAVTSVTVLIIAGRHGFGNSTSYCSLDAM